ncbi:MAG: SDR family oxidoreductase [Deltaproteobacteria bacterium]|nr:MAG: SDR family oxidoreductase [Deltaproteobacteria bacterium]
MTTAPTPADARIRDALAAHPRRWLVTGAAGFIGSHLAERLLALGQHVVGTDNFATGHRDNVDAVREAAGAAADRYDFREADVRDPDACRAMCDGVDIVLHQAALGSVPRSVEDPVATHEANVDGFLHLLIAARDAGVERFVYASSSAVYGDEPALPKVEDRIGAPLSPYAATKRFDELYAAVFQSLYGIECIGLRYFNVFGPRQDPNGPYAAVIPRWIARLAAGQPCEVYGDGSQTRDFCHVDNAVQANLLAALAPADATGRVYNVACGERTSLLELFAALRDAVAEVRADVRAAEPVFADPRPGDIPHSLADISLARERLGYEPAVRVRDGLAATARWFLRHRPAAR